MIFNSLYKSHFITVWGAGLFSQAVVSTSSIVDTSLHGFQILFTGTESEMELVDGIRSDMSAGSFSLVGKLDIEQFPALIYLAPLLVSNNTGPVHIAAALNTPVVDLYALTNSQHTPWQVPHRVLYHDVSCKYCYKSICPMRHHNCLRLVSPDSVVEATLDLWNEIRRDSPRLARNQFEN